MPRLARSRLTARFSVPMLLPAALVESADATLLTVDCEEIDTSYAVDVNDVGLFDTEPSTIASLHSDGWIVRRRSPRTLTQTRPAHADPAARPRRLVPDQLR